MIIFIYGINGAGKDRIAGKISKTDPGFVVVPLSRLLMYHLGLAAGYSPETELTPDAYRKLEETEEERITALSGTLCRETVRGLSDSGKIVLCLNHLALAKFFPDGDGAALRVSASPVSEWVKKEASGHVFIKAEPEAILAWRKNDSRIRSENLEEIKLQQRIAENQWNKLAKTAAAPAIVIENHPGRTNRSAEILKDFAGKLQTQTRL